MTTADPAAQPDGHAATPIKHGEPAQTVEECETLAAVRIYGLPKRAATSKEVGLLLKQLLPDMSPPREIRKLPSGRVAMITCQDAEQQAAIVAALDGHLWKGQEAFTLQATPKTHQQPSRPQLTKRARALLESEALQPWEKLADQVTPLWRSSYAEQQVLKTTWAAKIIADLKARVIGKDVCPTVLPLVGSPDVKGYRNKVEYSFGLDLDGRPTAGFMLGLYRDGLTVVLDASACLHVSDAAKRIGKFLNERVRLPDALPVYDRQTHRGFWRLAVVRTPLETGHVMVIVQYNPRGLSAEQVAKELEQLRDAVAAAQESLQVTCLLAQPSEALHNAFDPATPCKLLLGKEPVVQERLCGLSFDISPTSFFQVNTRAAELLYGALRDRVAALSGDTVVLDLCCGTGTIGLIMAKHARHVIGVEIVASAVEDARRNAAAVGLADRTEYICSPIEKALDAVRSSLSALTTANGAPPHVVAILDPPRAGVSDQVIQTLSQWSFVERVLYVSCDATQALRNFERLCGEFDLEQAQPFDLFPHTRHCEMVLEFIRRRAVSSEALEIEV